MPLEAEPAVDAAAARRFRDPTIAPIATSLGDLRSRIDALDARIVALLAERALCVRDATRFKRDPQQVRAQARQAEVIARVRRLADAQVPHQPWLADIVDATYRAMVAGFVAAEQRLLDETDLIEPLSERTSS